jgi:putative ABC transport system permease protein
VQAQRGEPPGNLVIRTAGDPMQLATSVRALIHRLSPEATISSIRTMDQLVGLQEVHRRFQTFLIGCFSILSLALAALGIFAIMHCSVARTHEIEFRIALGADRRDILSLIVSSGMRVAFAGTAVGLLAASWTTSALASALFEVNPDDPISFVAGALTLLIVALFASYLPARRAARVDPVLALHQN